MEMQNKIRKILALLRKAYGRPPALRKSDPIDELIRTVLSQNTSDVNSLKAFAVLKRNFRSWDDILSTDTRKVAAMIKHAGLANIKAKRIKEVLAEIKRREDALKLSSIKNLSVEDSLIYLMSLKGVGPKTAACVLLFSFAKPIMPVDTHIFRVTKRLGLIDDMGIKEAHEALSKIVPRDLIYDFHLGIIEHGRKTCKAPYPRCGVCLLYKMCNFKKKAFFKKRGQT